MMFTCLNGHHSNDAKIVFDYNDIGKMVYYVVNGNVVHYGAYYTDDVGKHYDMPSGAFEMANAVIKYDYLGVSATGVCLTKGCGKKVHICGDVCQTCSDLLIGPLSADDLSVVEEALKTMIWDKTQQVGQEFRDSARAIVERIRMRKVALRDWQTFTSIVGY